MARLKTTFPLRLSEVIAFFEAGNSLGDFRRGAGIVPNIPENNGVPTGFPIRLSQLSGVYDAPLYTPISVTASGVNVTNTSGTPVGVSNASVTGGDGTHTYSWAYISGDVTLTGSTTGSSASFAGTAGVNEFSVYRVTVNDGTTSDSADINVTLRGATA